MKFDEYIDEVYLLRNQIIGPYIREYMSGKEKLRFIPVSNINRFVKRIIAVVVGGLFANVTGLINDLLKEYHDNEDTVEALEKLKKDFGDPHISGFRLKKHQQDL